MIVVRAPMRISFAGGGTDLAAYYTRFGGFVVSAAITRYCYVIARPTADGSIHISSADYHVWETYPRGEIPGCGKAETDDRSTLPLPKAAIAYFADYGLLETGIDLFLASEVPPGTGLGSSSAMAVALVRAISTYLGMTMDAADVAELACRLEIERLGMPIGKQDQYASACGGLNTIAFTADAVSVRPLDLSAEVISALHARLMLFSTGSTRDSARILGKQKTDTETKPAVIQSLHRIKSLAGEMRAALLAGELDRFGQLLDRGWREKRRLSKNISTAAIDYWYDAARKAGATGGKIVGAGGGGFILLYCPQHRQQSVRATMTRFGLREMPFAFDFTGVSLTGAGLLPPAITLAHTTMEHRVAQS